MVNPADATEVVPYLTSAATIVYIQKWMKQKDVYKRFVKEFPGADRYAHWLMAGIMSLVAAAGIHYTWTGNLTDGGHIAIDIPNLTTIGHGISDWFKVYILQHLAHDVTSQGVKQ